MSTIKEEDITVESLESSIVPQLRYYNDAKADVKAQMFYMA